MKKVIFIILIIAAAGTAFTQNIRFSGMIRTGMALMFDDGEDTKPTLGMSSNAGRHSHRSELVGTYNNSAGTVGARMIFRLDIHRGGTFIPSSRILGLDEAFVWFKPFNWLEINGGLVEEFGDTSLDTPGGLGDLSIAPGNFLSVGCIFTPLNNLRIAFFTAPMGGINYSAISTVPGVEEGTMSNHLSQADYVGTARYTFPNIISLHLLGGYRQESADMGFGFNYLGFRIQGFPRIAADMSLENFANRHLQYGYFQFNTGQRIDFAKGPFGAGIRFVQFMKIGEGIPPGDDGIAHGRALLYSGYVQYRLENAVRITPRLDIAYTDGGIVTHNYRRGLYALNRTYDAFADETTTSYWAGKNRYDSGMVIDSTMAFELAPYTTLTLGYKLGMNLGDPLPNTAGIKNYNMIFIDFYIRF